jgi:hypothetical protein
MFPLPSSLFVRFAAIRSYLSTLNKQGADIFEVLVLTFQGRPSMPMLA